MSCYRPLKAFKLAGGGVCFDERARHGDILYSLELPCGQCIGCRTRRAQDWQLRVMHEASLWPVNSFITLTYGRDSLPPHGSLCHEDVQLFLKRARKALKVKLRYFMCGEYGPQTARPHYHMCLFNADFRSDRKPAGKSGSGHLFYESEVLNRLWGHGKCTVQDLTSETALYCAKYVIDKLTGDAASAYEYVDDDGVIQRKKAPYAAMSLKPGIGARWFEKFSSDIFRQDRAVIDGSEKRPPRYYDKLYKRMALKDAAGMLRHEWIEIDRSKRAALSAPDQTPERRAVREFCHEARVRAYSRKDV